MPDISMCAHRNCPLRHNCYRHADSGTKPNPYRQSYAVYTPTIDEDGKVGCDDYWPRRDDHADQQQG